MKKTAKSEIGEDLFLNLPSEIVLNILSRLDVRTAMSGKCVCKPWLDLLTTPEFVKSHLSSSLPCLVIRIQKIKELEMEKFVDGLVDLNRLNTLFHFELPFRMLTHSSVNGLIFLKNDLDRVVCNPITREYIKLPCPRQPSSKTTLEMYGFGVSRLSGQYKVVRISVDGSPQTPRAHLYYSESECQVYTLGTGLWRRIGKCDKFQHFVGNEVMELFCGNLHWWWQSTGASFPTQISRLDLETESFSTISGPPCDDSDKERSISSLRGCLCVCDGWDPVFYIWVMKEYGDEKSWTKELRMVADNYLGSLTQLDPIEVFENGDMFMSRRTGQLLHYSSNTKTVRKVDDDIIDSDEKIFYQMRLYTPSFLSLKSFATENVRVFTMELGGGGGAASTPLRWCWPGRDRGRESTGHGSLLWHRDGRSLRP